MQVRIKIRPLGLYNGAEWPAAGEVIDLPDFVAEPMIKTGTVEPVELDEETATPPDGDTETTAPPAGDEETATPPDGDVETATPRRTRAKKD